MTTRSKSKSPMKLTMWQPFDLELALEGADFDALIVGTASGFKQKLALMPRLCFARNVLSKQSAVKCSEQTFDHSVKTKSDLLFFTKRIHCRRTDFAFGKDRKLTPGFLLVFRLQPPTTHDCGIVNTCSFQPRAKSRSPLPCCQVHVYVYMNSAVHVTCTRRCTPQRSRTPKLDVRGHCI